MGLSGHFDASWSEWSWIINSQYVTEQYQYPDSINMQKTYVYSFLDFTNSCFHTAAKLVDQSLYIQTQNQHTDMNKLNKTEYNIVCLLTCIDSVGFVMYLRTP